MQEKGLRSGGRVEYKNKRRLKFCVGQLVLDPATCQKYHQNYQMLPSLRILPNVTFVELRAWKHP